MERTWLAAHLEAGRSIESIAREVGRHPSSVAYWMRRFGLHSSHAEMHRARGGLSREQLEPLVREDLTVSEIGVRVDRSPTTVRYWLRYHGLRTTTAARRTREVTGRFGIRSCAKHGEQRHVRRNGGGWRCLRCNGEAVTRRRRKVKAIIVREAGGRCLSCGYDRCLAALQFHHVDPAEKRFSLGDKGVARALVAVRAEAAKCVLLCANCHAEVEAGARPPPDAPVGGNSMAECSAVNRVVVGSSPTPRALEP